MRFGIGHNPLVRVFMMKLNFWMNHVNERKKLRINELVDPLKRSFRCEGASCKKRSIKHNLPFLSFSFCFSVSRLLILAQLSDLLQRMDTIFFLFRSRVTCGSYGQVLAKRKLERKEEEEKKRKKERKMRKSFLARFLKFFIIRPFYNSFFFLIEISRKNNNF